jgi:hypothetical protein
VEEGGVAVESRGVGERVLVNRDQKPAFALPSHSLFSEVHDVFLSTAASYRQPALIVCLVVQAGEGVMPRVDSQSHVTNIDDDGRKEQSCRA